MKVKWTGSSPKCDFCGAIRMEEFVDGKTKLGPWGIMCPEDYKRHGVGLGPGLGQRYKLERGSYYKIEG